jgi:shikimate dehydrogenase
MHCVDQVDPTAQGIGCINTVVNDNGRLLGYNSDGLGAISALRNAGADPLGKKVLVLGSGGAARAIAVTLAREAPPEQLTILGVKMDELDTLVGDAQNQGVRSQGQASIVGGQFTSRSLQDEMAKAEILLHCSPVGMHPNENNSLVPPEMYHGDMTVFDVVYNPRRTKLLQDAHTAGCRTIEGIEMFLGQAIVQFELWTGAKAPAEVMRQVVEAKL